MRQFEYKVLDFDCALHSPLTGLPKYSAEEWEDEINELGNKGWLLVAVISPPMAILGMSTFVRLFLRRFSQDSICNSREKATSHRIRKPLMIAKK